MDVSIIFVNYKTKDFTINAIKSVIEKTQGIDFEIFVVDNNSQDGSIEAIEQNFPNINIIKNTTNKGFGAANNIAIKQAKGKYIFCLNTDTLFIISLI
jgi:GT2 family glycosyltransferase